MPIEATVIGFLGADPEQRQAGSSTVTELRVASSHGRDDRKTTTWVRASVWGRAGDAAVEYLNKGDPVIVSGQLYVREWESERGSGTSVELDNATWHFAPSRRDDSDRTTSRTTSRTTTNSRKRSGSGRGGYG